MHIFEGYHHKEHFFTRADARVKLAGCAGILAMILSSDGIFFSLIIALLSLFICLDMKVPVRLLLIRFAEPLLIAAVLLFLKFFFSGNNPMFSIYIAGIPVTGYLDGLMEGIVLSSRIFGAVSVVALLGFATPFTDIISGLSWFRIPSQFVELLMLAYRYIFVLIEDASVIYGAQKNRLGYSGIRRSFSSLGTLAGELTIRAFDRSQKTALAMSQRGYSGCMQRSSFDVSFRLREIISALLIIAFAGVLWKIL